MSDHVLTAEELSQLLEISGVEVSTGRISQIGKDSKLCEQYRMLLQRIRELCKEADSKTSVEIKERSINSAPEINSHREANQDALTTVSNEHQDQTISIKDEPPIFAGEPEVGFEYGTLDSKDEVQEHAALSQTKSECSIPPSENSAENIGTSNNNNSDNAKPSSPPQDIAEKVNVDIINPSPESKIPGPLTTSDRDGEDIPQKEPVNSSDSEVSQTQTVVPFAKSPDSCETKAAASQNRTERIQLPNGMVGREYRHSIPLQSFNIQESHIPDNLSLKLDEDSGGVCGTPTVAGDFELRFKGFFTNSDHENSKAPVFVIARFTVVPDPRTLWRDIPSDSTALFHKPDEDSFCIDHDTIRLLAASKRGRSHAHKGTHRDDEARIEWLAESGWHILAVADGAGSCQYSRRGSEIALNIAIDHLSEALNGEAGTALVDACLAQDDFTSAFNGATTQAVRETLIKAGWKAVSAIRSEAEAHKLSVKDFSTTFLLLIHKETEKGHLVIGFSIGDGALVAYDANDGVDLLCTPDSGEFAGQTRFLEASLFQSNDIYKRIKINLISEFTCLMALTDGITDAKFATESELSQKAPWDALWSEISPQLVGPQEQAKVKMTEWLNFFIAGNHDDRSVALLTGVINND